MGKLTALAAKSLKEPGRYADGSNLYLVVGRGGAKSWIYAWRHGGAKAKRREMGLGSFKYVTLAEAREKAAEARKMVLAGLDPIAQKKRPTGLLFKDAAQRFIDAHQAAWHNPTHAAQWPSTLKAYVCPKIGDKRVADIATADILEILNPIWNEKTETANRVRGRIEQVLDWARAQGFSDGENPARWRGHLDKLLPNPSKIRKVQHHAALPHDKMLALYAELQTMQGIGALALRWTILTAVRTADTVAAETAHVDCVNRVWTIPSFSKTHLVHRVPLSDEALRVFKQTREMVDKIGGAASESQWLFPNDRNGNQLSENAMLSVLKRMGRKGEMTTHGCRATFSTWRQEATDYPSELAEMSLGHIVGTKVAQAYARGKMLEKRVAIMRDWANVCLNDRAAEQAALPNFNEP